jgi:hypothetical protein
VKQPELARLVEAGEREVKLEVAEPDAFLLAL